MKNFNPPIPVFEAHAFLKNKVNGSTATKLYNDRFLRYPGSREKLIPALERLQELEARLNKSITADEDTLRTLFFPFADEDEEEKKSPIKNIAAGEIIADAMIENFMGNGEDPCKMSFPKISDQVDEDIVARIADAMCNRPSEPADRELFNLFTMINECEWPQRSKLVLFDMILKPSKYAHMYKETIMPVAQEFSRQSELWLPLLNDSARGIDSRASEDTMIKETIKAYQPYCENYEVFFSVTAFNTISMFISGIKSMAFFMEGVLYYSLNSTLTFEENFEADLSRMMSVLGDTTRLNILIQIAKRPSYGRELAKMLNITPSAVTHHLIILSTTELITSETIGGKVFYSVRKDRLHQVIKMQQRAFFPDSNHNHL